MTDQKSLRDSVGIQIHPEDSKKTICVQQTAEQLSSSNELQTLCRFFERISVPIQVTIASQHYESKAQTIQVKGIWKVPGRMRHTKSTFTRHLSSAQIKNHYVIQLEFVKQIFKNAARSDRIPTEFSKFPWESVRIA